jgi:hypothetical protein
VQRPGGFAVDAALEMPVDERFARLFEQRKNSVQIQLLIEKSS